MKKVVFLVVTIVLSLGLVTAAGAQDRRELARFVDQSVGRVIVSTEKGWSSGSGYVVERLSDDRGFLFLTNNHVIDSGGRIEIFYADDNQRYKFAASVLNASAAYDMALLRMRPIDGHDFEPVVLPLANYLIEQGDAVYAVGFPGFADDFAADSGDLSVLEPTITSGIVGKRFDGTWGRSATRVEQLQHNAAINSGNSGGPLVNLCGTVVGLNTAKPREDVDGAFFSSSARAIQEFLDTTSAQPAMAGRRCSPMMAILQNRETLVALGSVLVGALVVAGIGLRRRMTPAPSVGPTGDLASRQSNWQDELTVVTGSILRGGGGSQPSGPAVLEVSIGGGKAISLSSEQLTRGAVIGRGRDVAVLAEHEKLSRSHAELRLRSHKLFILDLGSKNGTQVDGKALPPKTAKQISTRSQILLGGVPLRLRRGQSA